LEATPLNMMNDGRRSEGPIVRGRLFKVIRGHTWVWVGPEPGWREGDKGVAVLATEEDICFLPELLAVEARVAGLEHWLRSCSAEEESEVAHRAVEWARGTGMSASMRARWRRWGRELDGPRWIAAAHSERMQRTEYQAGA